MSEYHIIQNDSLCINKRVCIVDMDCVSVLLLNNCTVRLQGDLSVSMIFQIPNSQLTDCMQLTIMVHSFGILDNYTSFVNYNIVHV